MPVLYKSRFKKVKSTHPHPPPYTAYSPSWHLRLGQVRFHLLHGWLAKGASCISISGRNYRDGTTFSLSTARQHGELGMPVFQPRKRLEVRAEVSFPDSYQTNSTWRQACTTREYVILHGEILMNLIPHGFVDHFEGSSRQFVSVLTCKV